MIVMTDEQYRQATLGLNVLSMALFTLQQHPEIAITDLDGDPDPGALERWDDINTAAHNAALKARYACSVCHRPIEPGPRYFDKESGDPVHMICGSR